MVVALLRRSVMLLCVCIGLTMGSSYASADLKSTVKPALAGVADPISISGTSLSVAEARDGMVLTLGYQISSTLNTAGRLKTTLVGPLGEIVQDPAGSGAGYSLGIVPGTNWYYRDFRINMPPGASTGVYDVTYEADWGDSSHVSILKRACLSILPPIPVRATILMYHKVAPIPYSEYYVSTSEFRGQLAALKAYGYTTVTLRELMDCRAGIKLPPAKPLLVSFDDGYENFYTDACPALASVGFGSVSFIPTSKIGGNNSWDKGDSLPVINHLTWDEIGQASSTYPVDFESHTVTHAYLPSLGDADLKQELVGSRQDLGNRLGTDRDFISYPYGAYNLNIQKACRDAGYFAAVIDRGDIDTTCADKWALKRLCVVADMSVNSNPAMPWRFFAKVLSDPDIVVPAITINSIQYLDPSTGTPITGRVLTRGQTVKVRMTATNSGAAVDSIASLTLDTDTDPTNGSICDTHPGQDITATSWKGQKVFEWSWQVPASTPVGNYLAAVSFHDRYYVFRYVTSGYQPAFAVISE